MEKFTSSMTEFPHSIRKEYLTENMTAKYRTFCVNGKHIEMWKIGRHVKTKLDNWEAFHTLNELGIDPVKILETIPDYLDKNIITDKLYLINVQNRS
jgi:hypothetical protein